MTLQGKPRPALASALSGLLPDETGTLLLQSCLARGESCARAWTEFQSRERALTELFRTDRGELKRLGPLLLDNLRRKGVGADAGLLTVLRTGALREELRSRVYRETLEQALGTLEAAGVESILLGGAALAERVYPSPSLRHGHDIDLLVAAADMERAASALAAADYSREAVLHARDGAVLMIHRNSLPIRLVKSMYELAPVQGSLAEVREWSTELPVGESKTRVLSPEASLAYALARAAYSPRRSTLQWAADGWMICAATAAVKEKTLEEAFRRSRLPLPCAVLLGYLARIGAPVAPGLLGAVTRAAARTTALERDLALFGLRRGAPGGAAGVIRRAPDSRTRLALLTWLAFPSPGYLQRTLPAGGGLPTPVLYLVRAASAVRGLFSPLAWPRRVRT